MARSQLSEHKGPQAHTHSSSRNREHAILFPLCLACATLLDWVADRGPLCPGSARQAKKHQFKKC